jgi:hypothetical protein
MKRTSLGYFLLLSLIFGCTNDDPVESDPCSRSTLTISLEATTPATNCETSDGTISVSITGGKQPYTFLLNSEVVEMDQLTALRPGIYAITVRDANTCEASLENISIPAKEISFSTVLQEDNACYGGNGSAVINIEGGNSPYEYQIDNGSFSDNNTFTGLTAGVHPIQVKDKNGCIVTLNVTIPFGTSNVSWLNDIKPIIENYCARSGCHNGTSRPDLRLYDKAKYYASSIKSKTKDRSMPFDGAPLSNEQIALIGCWVDNGAPNN